MPQTIIVARFADGRVVKGTTHDFSPVKDAFHVTPQEAGAKPVRILVNDLKAVFFVKDMAGDPSYTDGQQFDQPVPGRKVRVTFVDGEVIVGTIHSYQPDRPAFFVSPADPKSNNDRVCVAKKAVKSVDFIT